RSSWSGRRHGPHSADACALALCCWPISIRSPQAQDDCPTHLGLCRLGRTGLVAHAVTRNEVACHRGHRCPCGAACLGGHHDGVGPVARITLGTGYYYLKQQTTPVLGRATSTSTTVRLDHIF